MTPRTGEQLQAARAEAAARFEAIGMAALPAGWTFKYRKALSGVAYCHGRKHIEAPRPVTRKALYIWLHECAHAHLHADPTTRDGKRHVQEFEAEQWAHERMRAAGVAVPRSMTKRAKAYVARKIRQAGKRATIAPEIRAYGKVR